MNNNVLTEVAPISSRDCFYIAERHKTEFTYPLHKHDEYELNFIAHCKGVRRTVGDSLEVVGEYDMCLLGGGIEHSWQQYECNSSDIHEITIQFASDLISGSLAEKNHFASIRRLLKDSETGVAFDMETILRIYERIETLLRLDNGFYQVLKLFEILYELSLSNYRQLSTSSFARVDVTAESRRVQKVSDYIGEHFKEEIRLRTLADLIGMTPSAFSRFFKIRTHRSICDYIIDTRLGYAARKLADSSMSILEICYTSGFNNISYFNRIFKKKKGCTPTEFRNNYHKNKIIV
ncbi:MAG: AraC family transcriptional regulator [Prevotella sp.]|nr:AraC family transcriptional regulator [Prevotella sp.]